MYLNHISQTIRNHLPLLQLRSWGHHYLCHPPMTVPGPVFSFLLGVSPDYAQAITGQVTEVTCPVIGWTQPEHTPNKRQKGAQEPGNSSLHTTCCPSPIARFMGPTWGPSGADRTQMGPMLASWTLLSGMVRRKADGAIRVFKFFQNSHHSCFLHGAGG